MATTRRARKNGGNSRKSRRSNVYIPSIRTLTRDQCPPGMIKRKGYTRKYSTAVAEQGFVVKKKTGATYRILPKTSKATYVEAACVKDVGLPGKGPVSIGPLRKGELKKYGYSYKNSNAQRRAALREAVHAYGKLGVYRKLNAVAKLTERRIPDASATFRKNRDWVHSLLG